MANTVRTTIVLPEATAARLRACLPPRKRSQFVAEAIEERLRQLEFETEREQSFGVWRDADYGHLRTGEDMARYLAELRDDAHWRSSSGTETE